MVRVFEFIAAAAEGSEGTEAVSELGPDRALDGIVAAAGCRAQALLGEQRGACEPGRVVGQDTGAVGVVRDQLRRGRGRLPRLVKERGAVGLRAGYPLEASGRYELLDLGLAPRPPSHGQILPLPQPCRSRQARAPGRTGRTGSAAPAGRPLPARSPGCGSPG